MDLYSENILFHYKNPKNYGEIKDATISTDEDNPSCGDELKIDFKINKNGKIEKIKFQGHGCAISQAAMSMLSEKLIGTQIKDIEKLKNKDIYDMLGVEIGPGRVKCALLGLAGTKKAALIYKTTLRPPPKQ